MLQMTDGTITELIPSSLTVASGGGGGVTSGLLTSNCIGGSYVPYYQPYTYWNSYPVYICTDKTKKAIEVLKALQAEKLLKCESVPRFIELVEKISSIL